MKTIITLLAGIALAATVTLEAQQENEPKCRGGKRGLDENGGCWMNLDSPAGCGIWLDTGNTGSAWTRSDWKIEWSGTCINDQAHGHGTKTDEYFSVRISTSEGQYVNGKKHGHWIEKSKEGEPSEGQYVNGKRHGHWIEKRAGWTNEGEYVNGKFHGHWIMTHTNGNTVEGQYVDGKSQGLWIYTYPDGGTYKGQYVDGKQHGLWINTFDGRTYKERYVNGVQQ